MRFETERLVVREFAEGDAPELFRICREPAIVRFMRDWSEGIMSPADYHGFIAEMARRGDPADPRVNKRYAVALKSGGPMVGMVGAGEEEGLGEVELAFFVAEARRGKGYAAEAAGALAERLFAASAIDKLIMTIDVANAASCAVARKCGFELYERRTPVGHVQPNMVSDSYFYFRRLRPA